MYKKLKQNMYLLFDDIPNTYYKENRSGKLKKHFR